MASPRVILASQSPRRRELLSLVGIAHDVMPADIDETPLPGELPTVHAERLAREKASLIAQRTPEALVIGADTIVVAGDLILGKPGDDADARSMLRLLSGRTHMVYTAVAIARDDMVDSEVEGVQVAFRELSEADIAAYVATGEPSDKAGAYGIQGYGSTLVDRIHGDFFAVMGLPLRRLIALCERNGSHVFVRPAAAQLTRAVHLRGMRPLALLFALALLLARPLSAQPAEPRVPDPHRVRARQRRPRRPVGHHHLALRVQRLAGQSPLRGRTCPTPPPRRGTRWPSATGPHRPTRRPRWPRS
jgi:septum formation protein